MSVELRKGGRAGAGLLRWKPNITWKKDRGAEPQSIRPVEEFPWCWDCPGEGSLDERTNFKGGARFDGWRWNDLHYSLRRRVQRKRSPWVCTQMSENASSSLVLTGSLSICDRAMSRTMGKSAGHAVLWTDPNQEWIGLAQYCATTSTGFTDAGRLRPENHENRTGHMDSLHGRSDARRFENATRPHADCLLARSRTAGSACRRRCCRKDIKPLVALMFSGRHVPAAEWHGLDRLRVSDITTRPSPRRGQRRRRTMQALQGALSEVAQTPVASQFAGKRLHAGDFSRLLTADNDHPRCAAMDGGSQRHQSAPRRERMGGVSK